MPRTVVLTIQVSLVDSALHMPNLNFLVTKLGSQQVDLGTVMVYRGTAPVCAG
jgi:hypothetical protein